MQEVILQVTKVNCCKVMRHTPSDISKIATTLQLYAPLLDGEEIWVEQNAAEQELTRIVGADQLPSSLAADTDRERNVKLRHDVSKLWNEAVATNRSNLAFELSRWIVKDWGGIRNISDTTIKEHHYKALGRFEALPFEGVASSSKVFSLVDPMEFQIYDARVAVSLNVLQLAANTDTRIYFEVPQTQITWISGSRDCFFARIPKAAFLEDFGFSDLPESEIYRYYTKLLLKLGVEAEPQLDPIEVEMALFGLAYPFSQNTEGALSEILAAERARLRATQSAGGA